MNDAFLTLPLLFGAFALYGGTYHLVHFLINRLNPEDLLFSGACLAYFGFNTFSGLVYGATDHATAAFWQKWSFSAGATALGLIYLFTFFFFQLRKPVLLIAILAGLPLALLSFVLPDAIDLSRPEFKTIFGREIFESARHPLLDLALAYKFGMLLWLAALLFREWYLVKKPRALAFLATYVLLGLLFLNDVLFLSGAYLSTYGVVFLLGAMSLNMALREKEMHVYQERANRLVIESQREFQIKQREHTEALELTRELVKLNRQSQASLVEIDQLNELVREINSMTEIDEVLDRILRYTTGNFGINLVLLLNTDEKQEIMATTRIVDHARKIPEQTLKELGRFATDLDASAGLAFRVFARKRPLYLRKFQERWMTEVDRLLVEKLKLKGVLLVPLTIQGAVKAVGCFARYDEPLQLGRTDRRSIIRFCDQIAGAVNSAALIQQVEVEREKSDRLLRNILPGEIAAELKEKGEVNPVYFDSVSVLFSDLVGFTRISERKKPREIIGDLNAIFLLFDGIADKYRLEKIKTIGDAYMAAGGLPRKNRTHPVDVCLAALEIVSSMAMLRAMHADLGGDFFEIRVGIHTGPLMAGVVGKNKFAYDIFGDSVNVASRMESGGQPGSINISEDTYKIVSPFFECEYRGELTVKNRGRVHEYFLKRIRPELARDDEGLVPNDRFRFMYETLTSGEGIVRHPGGHGLSITEKIQEHISILEIRGEINLGNSSALRERLKAVLRAGRVLAILDLRDLTFIDSTGIGTLIHAHRDFIQKQGRIVVINLPAKITEIFRGLGVGLYDKLSDALDDLESRGTRDPYPEDLDFNINLQMRGDVAVLRLAGRLNFESARILRERVASLDSGSVNQVILNLRDLKSIDSSGFGAIMFGHNQLREKNGMLRLVHIPAAISALFQLSNLEEVLDILPDEEVALRGVRS